MSEFLNPTEQPYERDPDENWHLRPDVAGYEYPDDGFSWRIGIVRDVVESPHKLTAISDILNTPFTSELTRNMARVVMTADLLRNLPDALRPLLPDLEVLISLAESGNADLADCYQAIFSRNADSRQTPPEVITQELAEATGAFQAGQIRRESGIITPVPEGITIQRLTEESDPKIKKQFVKLISGSFGDEDSEIREVIADEDSVALAATTLYRGKPRVIGTVYASNDADTLRRHGKNVKLSTFEVMGAKVRPEMEGRGIYTALSHQLLRELAARDDVDVVFGYSNATNRRVMSVAGNLGRTIVTDTARQLGLPIRPAMQQTITDGRLVDEVVTYMPGNQLRALYR